MITTIKRQFHSHKRRAPQIVKLDLGTRDPGDGEGVRKGRERNGGQGRNEKRSGETRGMEERKRGEGGIPYRNFSPIQIPTS